MLSTWQRASSSSTNFERLHSNAECKNGLFFNCFKNFKRKLNPSLLQWACCHLILLNPNLKKLILELRICGKWVKRFSKLPHSLTKCRSVNRNKTHGQCSRHGLSERRRRRRLHLHRRLQRKKTQNPKSWLQILEEERTSDDRDMAKSLVRILGFRNCSISLLPQDPQRFAKNFSKVVGAISHLLCELGLGFLSKTQARTTCFNSTFLFLR